MCRPVSGLRGINTTIGALIVAANVALLMPRKSGRQTPINTGRRTRIRIGFMVATMREMDTYLIILSRRSSGSVGAVPLTTHPATHQAAGITVVVATRDQPLPLLETGHRRSFRGLLITHPGNTGR